ncbi:hypothetical protein TNCV_919341 [Trichonephila clavipes]|nr:hypothetical protein TNCV_919341 [Trichonephila clavipes]
MVEPRTLDLRRGYATSKPPEPTNRKECWCTIMRKLNILVPCGLYFMQQLCGKWEICLCAGFFNTTTRSPNPSIRLTSSLVWLIVFPMVNVIMIFND